MGLALDRRERTHVLGHVRHCGAHGGSVQAQLGPQPLQSLQSLLLLLLLLLLPLPLLQCTVCALCKRGRGRGGGRGKRRLRGSIRRVC